MCVAVPADETHQRALGNRQQAPDSLGWAPGNLGWAPGNLMTPREYSASWDSWVSDNILWLMILMIT